MSIEHANAFFDRMRSDEEFRERIMGIENSEERLQAIRDAGFEFSQEDIDESQNIDSLTSAVAGGQCWMFFGDKCYSVGNWCSMVNPGYCCQVGY